MNTRQIFEEKGLFLTEQQKEKSELWGMFSGEDSTLFNILQKSLEHGNEVILIKNQGISSLFPNGSTAGILLNEKRDISCKSVLDFLSLKGSRFNAQTGQCYYGGFYSAYQEKRFLSVSRYSAELEKLGEETEKIAENQKFLPFSFTRITPKNKTDGIFSEIQIESYSLSENLYQLKRCEQFLRKPGRESEEYFFQTGKTAPILERLSKLEIPVLDDETHRVVRNRENSTQKSMEEKQK